MAPLVNPPFLSLSLCFPAIGEIYMRRGLVADSAAVLLTRNLPRYKSPRRASRGRRRRRELLLQPRERERKRSVRVRRRTKGCARAELVVWGDSEGFLFVILGLE